MDPQRVSPVQIPSEDDVPLFDPSGLSASLSADDWNNSFDLSSVAAARLGIGSPRSQDGSLSASISNLTRSDSNNIENGSSALDRQRNASGSNEVVPTANDALGDSLKRGRRRRSSAFNSPEVVSLPSDAHASSNPTKESSVGSKVRMWWQRSAPGSVEDELGDTSAPAAIASTSLADSHRDQSKDLPPSSRTESTSRPSLRTSFTEKPQGTEVQSPASMSPPTNPSVLRSPAADFLSNFSSMNSVISPPFASFDNRSLSYSPPRPGHRSLGTSLTGDGSRNGLPVLQSSDAWHGLGSAAAQLFDVNPEPLPGASPRLDDEGARVGPKGRYLLGKTIGFGGFSTVREGWDQCGEDITQLPGASMEGGPKGRKIAVKIVYHEDRAGRTSEHAEQPSHELDIWTRLPAHQHILPLLHHERITLAHPGSNPPRTTNAELLIMPFCDQGNLLDFVRSEGGAREVNTTQNGDKSFAAADGRSGSASWIASSSGKMQTQLTRSSSMKSSVNGNEAVFSNSGNRTGSGFVFSRPHGAIHLGRVASMSNAVPTSLRTIHAGQATQSGASSPASAAGSVSSESGLLRRMKSKSARSQGVPIDAARETMRQLASALLTLHTKVHVLHGDLKLENVLGQGKTSWKKRQRQTSLTSNNEDAEPDRNSLVDSIASLASSSMVSQKGLFVSDADMPCWRIADFGLAMIIGEGEGRNHATASPALVRALKEGAARHDSHQHPKSHKSGRGGSLAYTAPECLRATQTTSGASSPASVAQAAGQGQAAKPSESPYAADMWALGCILYALLSGRLPFADSFEPRLQMKIAKAQWEFPARLRRRAERLAASAAAASASKGQSQRNSSGSLIELPEGQVVTDRFAFMNQKRSASVAPSAPASFGVMDLSASLPSLLPRERQATVPAVHLDEARRTPKVHSEHVVGSAPGRAGHLESFEINEDAKALAEVEEDPESDEDPDLDPAWDGLSWDRAAARELLLGLLEPDPARRWTIERVCSSAWIRQEDRDVQPSSLFDVAAKRSSGTSNATTFGPATGLDNETRFMSAASFSAVPKRSSPPKPEVPLVFQKGSAEMSKVSPERGRRSSSLARSRPATLLPGSPSNSFFAPTDDDSGSYRRSRSTSRVPIGYRSNSRTRSNDISEDSTPNRDKDSAWLPHPLGASLTSQGHRAYGVAGNRCDSPAESERRGRHPRIRMADLDENKTWTGDEDASSDSRSGSRSGTASRAMPIPIRGESQSRSRSRHSRESTSPDPMARRSISRSRSVYSMSHDPTGSATGLLYGRSTEIQPMMAAVEPERVQAQRSSTSRSRSRAPDALAQILGRGRSTSRPRGNSEVERPSSGLGISNYHHPHQQSGAWNRSNNSLEERADSPLDERGSKQMDNREAELETRGRARDRKG